MPKAGKLEESVGRLSGERERESGGRMDLGEKAWRGRVTRERECVRRVSEWGKRECGEVK